LQGYEWIKDHREIQAAKPALLWVSSGTVGGIIGRNGQMIECIKKETDTEIRIYVDNMWAPNTTTISLHGEQAQVAAATRRIRGIEAKINREIVANVTINPSYYR
jgi:polyribonucleotide nucleotidyltransferase